MRIGVLKPRNGWRALFGEVGIIVLGVLIALAAGQAVEWLNQQAIARETRATVEQEIRVNLGYLQLRGEVTPCIDRRLSEVRGLVEVWGRTGTFVTPSWVAQTPSLDWTLTSYDAAVSAGRLALLPAAEQYRLGALASALKLMAVLEGQEQEPWAMLRMLQSGPAALSISDRSAIRQALQSASMLNYNAKLQVSQILAAGRDAGLRPDLTDFRRTARRIWASGRFTPAICAGIDLPSADANRQTGQVIPLPE